MIKRDDGAASRAAFTRARSEESPPSLSFKIGEVELAFAAAPMFFGVSRLMVNDVTTSEMTGMLASSQTRLLEVFDSNSHSAQSSAVRAADAGKCFCSRCRSRLFSRVV